MTQTQWDTIRQSRTANLCDARASEIFDVFAVVGGARESMLYVCMHPCPLLFPDEGRGLGIIHHQLIVLTKRSPFCWEDSPCADKDHHTGDFIGPSWKGVAQSNPIHINRHAVQSQSLLLTWTSRATNRPAQSLSGHSLHISLQAYSLNSATGQQRKLLPFPLIVCLENMNVCRLRARHKGAILDKQRSRECLCVCSK